jgi:hypothetical protein
MKHVLKVINWNEFLKSVPKFCNARETHLNIDILITVFILVKKQLLSYQEISEGLRAFTLAGKETKIGERIKLETSKINQALRLINKSMSESRMMEKWIELCGTDLDWFKKRDKTTIEFEYDPSDTRYLLPHEFLFLLWNAQDRIELIKKTKTLDLNLNKKVIRDFDFWDGVVSRQIIEKNPHIYLLSPKAFENQAPNYQIK